MRWTVGVLALAVGTGAAAHAPSATVVVRTFQFQEARLDLPAGARVVWTNRDAVEHTVTSGIPDRPDGRFQGRLPEAGATFRHRFDRPGVYPYFCARHPFMRGEIRVVPATHGEP